MKLETIQESLPPSLGQRSFLKQYRHWIGTVPTQPLVPLAVDIKACINQKMRGRKDRTRAVQRGRSGCAPGLGDRLAVRSGSLRAGGGRGWVEEGISQGPACVASP